MQTYTAVVKNEGGWWIGWIEEVPGVKCQEASREELLETLRITLAEAIDASLERLLNLNLHLGGVAPSRDELHER